MASHPESAAPKLRWGRAFVAGLGAEAVLMVIAVPFFALMQQPVPTLSLVIPPASLVVFAVAGHWAAKPVPGAGVLQGALSGVLAVAIYAVLLLGEWLFFPAADLSASLSPAYLVAHLLKIVGGAIGGWLVSRKAPAAPPG